MAVGLDEKVAFLRSLTAFDQVVDCIETHMSFVFLTGNRALKLEKPVRLPHLDHGTLEQRRESCLRELRLGRRLAADVYEDVVPLARTPGGLVIEGEGEVVDWLLVMRRLADERMLPQMLARGAATPADAERVGDLLSAFYRDTARATWDGPQYRRQLRNLVVAVSGELVARGADRVVVGELARAQLATQADHAALLDARIAEGRVVDAHGDLRPEHVCLEIPPVIIDPLEFDDDLRTLDAASELAFFVLECERSDGGWFGRRVFERYLARTGDRPPAPVLALYRSQHATTRALLALRHLDDVPPAEHARWRAKADDYLRRAAA